MKFLLLIGLAVLFSESAQAQRYDYMYNRKRNAVVMDIGGRTMFWSANYERLFMPRERTFIVVELGFSYFPFPKLFSESDFELAYYIPHGATVNWGKYRSYLEFGFHGTYLMDFFGAPEGPGQKRGYILSPLIGYRNEGFKGGLIFKAYLALLHYLPLRGTSNFKTTGFPGICIGWAF